MAKVNALVTSMVLASTLLACGDDAPVPPPALTTDSAVRNDTKTDSTLKKMEKKGRVSKVQARRGTLCD